MSLKKYKSKGDLLGDNFDLKLELEDWYTSYWDWDDDYYDYSECDNCGKSYCDDYEYCQPYDYIQLPKFDWGYKVIKKAFRRWDVVDPSLYGSYIDMESIYGKIEMRNRRIDIVLGLREPNYTQPVTIGDFFDRIDKNPN
jgi:hypothetical protein